MRKFIFLAFSLSFYFNYSQSVQNDSILIFTKDLLPNWSHFCQDTINYNEDNDGAYISSSIRLYPQKIYCWDIKDIKVVCVMNKKLSNAKTKTKYLLNHERGHFKITEIFTRKIREYINKLSFEECDLSKVFDDITHLQLQERNFNETYDRETNHSEIIESQKKWDKKIDSLLNVYKNYERDIYIEDLGLD